MTHNSTPPTTSNRLPRLYTVRDTAVYAQTSEKTVRRWLKSGVVPFHPIADAALRQFVRLLARIAVAEALGTADADKAPSGDLPA